MILLRHSVYPLFFNRETQSWQEYEDGAVPAGKQKPTVVEMFPTRVHPLRGTFHEKGTVGPGPSRSRPPSSAEQAASPETDAVTKDC